MTSGFQPGKQGSIPCRATSYKGDKVEENDMNQEEDEYFSYLLEVGAIEIQGVAESGELMFKPNPEKMKEYAPEMFSMMQAEIEEGLMELYKEGLVDMEYDENLEAKFKMSDKGIKEMERFGFFRLDEPGN